MNPRQPGITDEMYRFTLLLISGLEQVDKKNADKGSILVFLPGIYEIGRLRTFLMDHREA